MFHGAAIRRPVRVDPFVPPGATARMAAENATLLGPRSSVAGRLRPAGGFRTGKCNGAGLISQSFRPLRRFGRLPTPLPSDVGRNAAGIGGVRGPAQNRLGIATVLEHKLPRRAEAGP